VVAAAAVAEVVAGPRADHSPRLLVG
jgi:hypothetical protein